jgi:small subunit ribosomal protein S16
MLKIRLQRVGRIHEPAFRLVLTDSKNSTKSGKFEEVLGSYDPRKNTEAFKADRIQHWISQGVGITPTINNLLIKKGIIRGKKVHVSTVPPIAPAEETAEEANIDVSTAEKAVQASSEAPQEPAPEV